MRLWPMFAAAWLSMGGCAGGAAPDEELPGQQTAQTEPAPGDRSLSTLADTPARTEADTAAACHPSYPDACIPPPPPDMKCADVTGKKPFTVRHDVPGADPHAFDRDRDGKACEPRPRRRGGK